MMEHKWYDTVLDKLGLMTKAQHDEKRDLAVQQCSRMYEDEISKLEARISLLEDRLSKELGVDLKTYEQLLDDVEYLITENETAAVRLDQASRQMQMAENRAGALEGLAARAYLLITKYGKDVDEVMEQLGEQLESFLGFHPKMSFIPEEEEDASDLRSETAPEDSGEVPADP